MEGMSDRGGFISYRKIYNDSSTIWILRGKK